jgi:hypothetical protein
MRKWLFLFSLFFSSCLPNFGLDESSLKFDRQVWRTTDKESGEREMMLNDLYKNHLKVGMPGDSVKQLLGAPDTIFDNRCRYLISIGYDPCWLEIKLENNVLESYEKVCY